LITEDEIQGSDMPRIKIVYSSSINHDTFFHKKKLLKPAPKASFTRLFGAFYPLDREKTQFFFAAKDRFLNSLKPGLAAIFLPFFWM